jgi:hypothetical protein
MPLDMRREPLTPTLSPVSGERETEPIADGLSSFLVAPVSWDSREFAGLELQRRVVSCGERAHNCSR